MKTIQFKFTDWVILKYDTKSPEFRAAFETFQNGQPEDRTSRVTYTEFLGDVAGQLTENGDHEKPISAGKYRGEDEIGHVWLEGDEKPEQWCGIIVKPGYNGRHTPQAAQ